MTAGAKHPAPQIARLTDLEPRGWPRPCVAVGNFDGVHRGHQALIRATVAAAAARDGTAAVLTFDPHPARVIAPGEAPPALMTFEQKARTLAALGVRTVAVLPFTPALAARTAADFARDVLARALGAEVVVVGPNFRFGRGREGNPERLASFGREHGFVVEVVPPVMEGEAPVSSSRVRGRLLAGDVAAAARLIGRPFEVEGVVVHGDGRGRALGFPTANIEPRNEVRPAAGVYACLVGGPALGPAPAPAVVNVGRRPTFGGGEVTIEAHLLDPCPDLYGQAVRVAFRERLREERRFPGVEALVAQVREDVAHARRLLRDDPPGGDAI